MAEQFFCHLETKCRASKGNSLYFVSIQVCVKKQIHNISGGYNNESSVNIAL